MEEDVRIKIQLRLEYRIRGSNSSYTKVDLSDDFAVGGLFIKTFHPLKVGEILEILLIFPGGESPWSGLAEVKWIRISDEINFQPPGMGIQIVEHISSRDVLIKKIVDYEEKVKVRKRLSVS